MSTITTGRTLDGDGDPIPGTGFEVEPDSWLADRIRERVGPIQSHPTRSVWGVPVAADGDTVRTVSVVGGGYGGPPPHYHTQSRERFSVERGELTLELDGRDRVVTAGETETVATGVEHSFRADTDDRVLVVTEIDTPGRLRDVLPTLGGLAHDDDRDPEHPLQQAVIADRLADNTVFTAADGGVTGLATDLLAPLGRAAGYRAAYAEYRTPAFWRAHVEQPSI